MTTSRITRRRGIPLVMLTAIVAFVATSTPAVEAARRAIAPRSSVATISIRDAAITTPKLRTFAVTAPKLRHGAVTAPKLAAGAVTSRAIADGTITAADLASGVLPADFDGAAAGGALSGSYPSPTLAAGSVGATQLAVPSASAGIPSTFIANNATTTLPLTSTRWAVNGMAGPSANRLVATHTGLWRVEASVVFASSGVGQRQLRLVRGSGELLALDTAGAANSITSTTCLTAGDQLGLEAFQNSGGPLEAAVTTVPAHLTMTLVTTTSDC